MVKEGYDWEVTIPSLYLAGNGAEHFRSVLLVVARLTATA